MKTKYIFRNGETVEIDYNNGELRVDSYELKDGERWITQNGRHIVVNEKGETVLGGGIDNSKVKNTNTKNKSSKNVTSTSLQGIPKPKDIFMVDGKDIFADWKDSAYDSEYVKKALKRANVPNDVYNSLMSVCQGAYGESHNQWLNKVKRGMSKLYKNAKTQKELDGLKAGFEVAKRGLGAFNSNVQKFNDMPKEEQEKIAKAFSDYMSDMSKVEANEN